MFYQAVIQTIEELLLEDEQRALLAWWNGYVFVDSTCHRSRN